MNSFDNPDKGEPSRKRSGSTTVARVAYVTALGVALAGFASLPALTGCGSASHTVSSDATRSTTTGSATVSITWPTRSTSSRLIPVDSNSIIVAFSQNGTLITQQVIARPTTGNTTTTTFPSLPTGTLTAQAAAYPTSSGTGTAQAVASVSATITSGNNTAVAITMNSTIDHLVVTPASPSVAAGATTTLTGTAYDPTGAVVLTSASTINWASSNTAVATVSSTGVVTGVAAGTATITVTESESGKSASTTATVTGSTSSTIVDLANAYIATLSTAQKTATVTSFAVTNAEKWSNLPAPPNSDGTTSLRNGVDYGSLTTAQQTAWNNLINALLNSKGLTQFNNIRAADYTLNTQYNANGYSGDYEYIAFVGTPTTSGDWMIQLGGHHNAHNYYFSGTTLDTTVPYHLGTEPADFTYNGTTYSPLSDQKTAMTNLLTTFSMTQLSSAKLSGSFGDLYLGAGQDARADFPTGTTGRGILVSSLTTAQQTLVKTAIDAWVSRSPQASTYETLYYNELSSTYVGYAGNSSAPGTVFTAQGDYIRIDGPHVWIEFVCQNGVVIPSKIHYHSIWRDRVNDYNAVTAGWTLYNHSNGGM